MNRPENDRRSGSVRGLTAVNNGTMHVRWPAMTGKPEPETHVWSFLNLKTLVWKRRPGLQTLVSTNSMHQMQ